VALLVGLALMIIFTACSDERTAPTLPDQPSYNETKILLDREGSNDEEVTAEFTVRDIVTDGKLILYCFLQPDEDVLHLDELTLEIETFEGLIDSISAVIFDRWVEGSLTVEDSVELENVKAAYADTVAQNEIEIDLLDTWLDDRYNFSIRLDDDTPLYPNAVHLDTSALEYLASDTIAWGQGNYLTETDADGWRGKRIELDLDEFWVADPEWMNPTKPLREDFLHVPATYPDRYTQYELLPVRNWLERLTPGDIHNFNIRFGAAETVTEISVSLYLVYRSAE